MDILWNNFLVIYWKLLVNKVREAREWWNIDKQLRRQYNNFYLEYKEDCKRMEERQKLEVLQGGKK